MGDDSTRRRLGVAVERVEHALDHAAVDGADHRVLDGGVAERAVLGHDAQLVAALLGVGGEPVGGERVGDGVQRGAERALDVGRSGRPSPRPWPGRTRRRPPRPWPRPASRGSRARARPSRVTSRSSWRTGDSRRHLLGAVDAVALRRPAGAAALACARRRPRGSRRRPACRGGGGRRWGAGRSARPPRPRSRPRSLLVDEEVDVAAGRVAEGGGDGGDRASANSVGRERATLVHAGILPTP